MMLPYMEQELAKGNYLSHMTRHMLGLFHGQPGGRQWRRILSEEAVKPGAGPDVIERALQALAMARQSLAAAE
jgi:tRNA-dihydrouridine synthase A